MPVRGQIRPRDSRRGTVPARTPTHQRLYPPQTLTRQPAAAPPAPPRGNTINITLDKGNLARIWESGTFAPPEEIKTATQSPTPMATPTQLRSPEVSAETNVNKSQAATPRPSPQRTPTPRPSPTRTPIVVGNAAPTNRP
ncbi:hypothetical protein [Leptolyngbya sp. 7M]|uniref:hypothetical protein n=1 Tax=Leptolyngbya sp. 7M TaxID=2812896 RepID=UPI001B8B6693|nr:hypothetical protein [Leptolyngbya sp. 7M]QYO67179.1 hypothetical protein JVX88_10460 [Leptolyngbya sp. 7M]